MVPWSHWPSFWLFQRLPGFFPGKYFQGDEGVFAGVFTFAPPLQRPGMRTYIVWPCMVMVQEGSIRYVFSCCYIYIYTHFAFFTLLRQTFLGNSFFRAYNLACCIVAALSPCHTRRCHLAAGCPGFASLHTPILKLMLPAGFKPLAHLKI